jgi:putative spermidine/putrescine transport system substrate-binding protein
VGGVASSTQPAHFFKVDWVLANPGKFTYANPGGLDGDYTGSAFIRHFLYEFGGGYQEFAGAFNLTIYLEKVTSAFAKLREMEPGIYQQPNTTVPFYPASQIDVDNLFAMGEICITLSYDPDHVGQLIFDAQGLFLDFSRSIC